MQQVWKNYKLRLSCVKACEMYFKYSKCQYLLNMILLYFMYSHIKI